MPQAEYTESVSPSELGRLSLVSSVEVESAAETEALIIDSLPTNSSELNDFRSKHGLDPLNTYGLRDYINWKNKTNRLSRQSEGKP